jgi:hypothetical protein
MRRAFVSIRAAVQLAATAVARIAREAPAAFFERTSALARSLVEQVQERVTPRDILERAGGLRSPSDLTLAANDIMERSNRILTADTFQQVESQYGAAYRVVVKIESRNRNTGEEMTRHITLTSQRALSGREWYEYILDAVSDIETNYGEQATSVGIVGTFARI